MDRAKETHAVRETDEPILLGHDRHASTFSTNEKVPGEESDWKAPAVSEWSHQATVPQDNIEDAAPPEGADEEKWEEMRAFAKYDIYDDDTGRIVAHAGIESDEEQDGAGKGYTRVNMDEDAQSATSMDENTSYLFTDDQLDDEAARTPLSQMQATKELLTEGQRLAYVGLCKVIMMDMIKRTSNARTREVRFATEAIVLWSQKMMVRLFSHMEILPQEQIMIEQLFEHNVTAADLAPTLITFSKVKNPLAQVANGGASNATYTPSMSREQSSDSTKPDVKNIEDVSDQKVLDLDIRWTVLCDLFLVLIADSIYDARSRILLERVGGALEVNALDVCRFEKRVTDALEIQENAQQNWSEEEHVEARRKLSRNKRYMLMGAATLGGSLVIGLSAGLLFPVIGAGLGAAFTTIGVGGTTGFLTGAGGAALITSTGVATGGTIAVRGMSRRTEAVKTFEFKPLHNNKRVNLILTISGWMSGKEDDVRLPFSTVDPLMGDIFSLYWEPELLQSMGSTINILATEVLTQSVQQVLGSTVLIALMSSLQWPLILTKLGYLIDNPWSTSLQRAKATGHILADTLINRNLGVRPITLVGFSLGARAIFYCLLELARVNAFGLIQDALMFGSPIVVKKKEYISAQSVVAGRFVNGYVRNDWILGYLFRATSGGLGRVAGLRAVSDIEGIENVDCTEFVDGHMAYREAMPRLMRHVGWEVTSDEFTEIEDPDPDRHRERQRELIDELEEAKKKAATEPRPRKSLFNFLGRKGNNKTKEWEIYDEKHSEDRKSVQDAAVTGGNTNPSDVLFDIDMLRKELQSDGIEIKELETTLPPLITRTQSDMGAAKVVSDTVRKGPNELYNTGSSKDFRSSAPDLTSPMIDKEGFENVVPEKEAIAMAFDSDFVSPTEPRPLEEKTIQHSMDVPSSEDEDEGSGLDEDASGEQEEGEIVMTFG